MKVLDYGAERKWQGLSALSVPLLPKPQDMGVSRRVFPFEPLALEMESIDEPVNVSLLKDRL